MCKILTSLQQFLTKFYIFINIVIIKYNQNLLDQLLLLYKSYGRYMPGIYFFFIFASCELLKLKLGQAIKLTHDNDFILVNKTTLSIEL